MSIIYRYIPEKDSDNSGNLPLVSIVMTSYNQQDLSRKALKSLFKQDYCNLEIIITDDHSSDDSMRVLTEECDRYAQNGGLHPIIFSQNERNLGEAKNYEVGFKLAKGELLITAGGDDISHPHRVSCIVKHWLEMEKKPTVIFHGLRPINMDDTPLDYEWWKPTLRNPLGAAMAYAPVVVRDFPEITQNEGFEDNIFARRAYLFGEILYIKDRLIDYRIGSGVTSSGSVRTKREKISKGMTESTKQNYIDLDYVKENVSPEKILEVKKLAEEIADTYGLEHLMITGKNPFVRIKAFSKYARTGNRLYPPTPYWIVKHYIPLMFPKLTPLTNKLIRVN